MNAARLRRVFLLSLPLLTSSGIVVACGGHTSTASTDASDAGADGGPVSTGPFFNDASGGCPAFDVMVDTGGDGGDDGGDASDDGGDASAIDAGAANVGDFLPSMECLSLCRNETTVCQVTAVNGTAVTVSCSPLCGGRKPSGLAEGTRLVDDLGSYFAEMARMEAASVHAFRVMMRELTLHGAPRSLIARARRAARDEIKHARAASAMARQFGGHVEPVCVEPTPPRSLFEMALENEIEGCVRETFGALAGMHQARFATNGDVRIMMKTIARDESRHAALSHCVSTWARSRLSSAQCAALDAAREAALREEESRIQRGPLTPWQHTLGLPGTQQSHVLLSLLRDESRSTAA